MTLSQHQIEQIRRALQGGVAPLEIARRLSVSLIAIAHIVASGFENALPQSRRADAEESALPARWLHS